MYKNSQSSYKAQSAVKRSNFSTGSSQRLATYSKAINSKTKKNHTSALNQSSLVESEEEEYVPCIKLYPVPCDSYLNIQTQTNTDQSFLDTESYSTSITPIKKKRVNTANNKRKSQDFGSKNPIDKLPLKTLNTSSSSSSHQKQNTRLQQSYKAIRTNSKVSQKNHDSKTLYTKVLKQVTTKNAIKKVTKAEKSFTEAQNDPHDVTILNTSIVNEKANHSYIAYSSVNLTEENRPKSSLEGRIGNYSSLPRDQKTPLRNGDAISYEKLSKFRGSKMGSFGSSHDFSRQSTMTTKDGTPTPASSKSREVSIKTLPDETRPRKSSSSLRRSHDTSDIKRLNEVQNTRLDDFSSATKIKVPQGIKVVKSLDLDQSRELIAPNKGFLSKINSSNYQVPPKSKDVKSIVQKSPFKNDGKALLKKKQGKAEVVSVTLSKSLISLKKL